MKKLCFVCFNIEDMGGINRVVSGLCNEFCKNHLVHIVSICDTGKKCYYSLNSEVKIYKINNLPEDRIRNIVIKSFMNLKKYFSDNKFDIIFMEGHYIPPIVLLIKFFTKSKFVFCDHGALSNQLNDKKATFFRKIASKYSDKVIVLTDSTKKEYMDKFKINSEKIISIPNFIDEDIFKYRGKYNENSKLILSSGRLTREKGFEMIPNIGEKIFDKYPDWQWHIYGDGPEYESIQRKIANKKMEKHIILKGFADNMYKKYNEYGIFVLPSYREGFALVLLEAKANSIPMVSFDCVAGPSEIINDNMDGYLVPCYNEKVMSEKICALIEDNELRSHFSQNCLIDIDKFDKKVIIKKWEDIINDV